MQLHFKAISEPGLPGLKWQKLFNTFWPAYKAWYDQKGASFSPDLKTSQAALKKYMPEMWPTYKRLCKLARADKVAARFLTGWQPPAYIGACSQAVLSGKEIQLVRNYDFHPDLSEGSQLLTAWNGKKVIATGDCLIGAIDGMNEDGLAISLTFGGRKEVGPGFGIPFILRYVLEFCSTVEEAVVVLCRVPSHMSYNVTVTDKSGAYKTVRVAPDRAPLVTDAAFATNHQGMVDWPENAAFNKTLERAAFLNKLLSGKITADSLADEFLKPPLYNKLFRESFGTLFTAVYKPAEGKVQLRWPNNDLLQTFDDFKEEERTITYAQREAVPKMPVIRQNIPASGEIPLVNSRKEKEKAPTYWEETLTDIMVNVMAGAKPHPNKKQLEHLRGKMLKNGEISWKAVADFWSRPVVGNWDKWKD